MNEETIVVELTLTQAIITMRAVVGWGERCGDSAIDGVPVQKQLDDVLVKLSDQYEAAESASN
jgi:hypothetical protein